MSENRRIVQGLWFTTVAAVMAFWPEPAAAATAFADCINDADLAANSCYQNADGYWEGKKCDWSWDLAYVVCAKAYLP